MHPFIRPTLDVRRLARADLEALVALKLREEAGVELGESRTSIELASAAWLTTFLERGAPCIAESPLDVTILARARAFYGPPASLRSIPLPEVA